MIGQEAFEFGCLVFQVIQKIYGNRDFGWEKLKKHSKSTSPSMM